MEIFVNVIFNCPQVSANFRNYHFLDDLDFVDDLDLLLGVTKKILRPLAFTLGLRLPLFGNPNTVSVCVPTSNHPHVPKILSKKNQIMMTLTFIVTFKSNLSFQNV